MKHIKSKWLVSVMGVLFILSIPCVNAGELPFGVSPKEITLTGTLDIGESQMLGFSKGRLTQEYQYKVGNRVGVKLSGIEYSLNFWNVGEMGGTSGYLFWKKDFSKASLHLEYNIGNPGQIITEEKKTPMGMAYPMEPADQDPNVEGVSCSLRFTGGPTGVFKGTCGNGAMLEGRVAGAGAYVIFEKVIQPEDEKEQALALSYLQNKEMPLSGQFGDWKFDASTLEDSNARFSSLTGEVETRHDNDTVWNFAKLNTVLYVLDHVKTGEESQAIIGFADLSTFLLKEGSEIVVTTPPKKNSKIGLVLGNIKANIKKMMKDGTMEVEMSQAIAGARGTRFVLTETGTSSKVEVTEGTVAFRSKVNGSEVMVSAGESVTATPSGLGEKIKFDPAALDAELVQQTAEAAPTPIAADEPTKGNRPVSGGKGTEKSGIAVAAIVMFIIVIGGVWVVKRKKGKSE